MKYVGFIAACFLFQYASAQLGELVEKDFNVKPTKGRERDCESWSSWGPCIWLNSERIRPGQQSNLFLDQLSEQCQRHWFFRFLDNKYGATINNVIQYLSKATVDKTPCGLCSYRHSCGYAGRKECHKNPLNTKTRKIFDPLYVKEKPAKLYKDVKEDVCAANLVPQAKGEKPGQSHACTVKKSLAIGKIDAKTGRRIRSPKAYKKCQVWPSHRVQLPGLTEKLKRKLYKLHWSNCVESKIPKERKYCRCCCEPFTPVRKGKSYVCVKKGSSRKSRSKTRRRGRGRG